MWMEVYISYSVKRKNQAGNIWFKERGRERWERGKEKEKRERREEGGDSNIYINMY